jgi:hypothetical protein
VAPTERAVFRKEIRMKLNRLNGLNGPVALCIILLVTLMSATSYGQDASCTYSVSPDSLTFFEASGGTAEIRVKASAPTCTFNARTEYPWMTVSAKQEHGEGKVSVTVDANGSLYRVGSVLIDGEEVTILQYGPRRGSTGS